MLSAEDWVGPAEDCGIVLGTGAFGNGATIVTFPTRNPASFKASVAALTVCPIKLGMTNACGGGGCAARRLILGAEILVALGDGLWPMT